MILIIQYHSYSTALDMTAIHLTVEWTGRYLKEELEKFT